MIRKFSIKDTIGIIAGSSGAAMILGGWLYVDTYFAHANDLKQVSVTMEQSLILLRIDVLENRIDRSLEKCSSGCQESEKLKNDRKIERLKNQIRRLEARQNVLMKKEF